MCRSAASSWSITNSPKASGNSFPVPAPDITTSCSRRLNTSAPNANVMPGNFESAVRAAALRILQCCVAPFLSGEDFRCTGTTLAFQGTTPEFQRRFFRFRERLQVFSERPQRFRNELFPSGNDSGLRGFCFRRQAWVFSFRRNAFFQKRKLQIDGIVLI